VLRDPALAAWLVTRRREIDRALSARLGGAVPGAAAPETEALRRFRSCAASSIAQGRSLPPALDGLRADEARVADLVDAWCAAAADVAGARADAVRDALAPLAAGFRAALRVATPARHKSGAPRTGRRAVTAAIDRVADAFLALDAASARIVDANPAAGALLRVPRDALLHGDALRYVPADEHARWWTELEAMSEGGEPRRFGTRLVDLDGAETAVDASVTRYASRERTLALLLLRARE
jgi:PAS domain-containing protein